MKKKRTLLFLAVVIGLMLLSLSTQAQNILTESCNLMQPGDSVTMQIVDYVDAGEGGDNAVWDFSGLDCSGVYYIKYDTINQSQLVGYDAQNTYKYHLSDCQLLLSTNESALLGMEYLPPQLMQVFPFQYSHTVSKEYRGEGRFCGTHFERTFGTIQRTSDGQGTLILSENDTLQNTLRVYTVNTSAIRLNSDSCRNDSSNLKQVITERYQWYARGYRYPVFETFTSSTYDNLCHVATQQYAYCCPPSVQKELSDPINEEIRHNDMLARQNEKNNGNNSSDSGTGDGCQFNYEVTINGNQVTLTYDISGNAHIHIMMVDIMGVVYHDVVQTNAAGSGYTIEMDCSSLHRGQYIIYLNVNGKIYNSKISVK